MCWEKGNAYSILLGKSLRNISLGKPKTRWESNIKMDLREIGCEDGRWIELAQDRVQWRALVLAVLNLGVLLPSYLCYRFSGTTFIIYVNCPSLILHVAVQLLSAPASYLGGPGLKYLVYRTTILTVVFCVFFSPSRK
jgi:hypothetical protein